METNSSGDELLKTSSKETNCLETKSWGTDFLPPRITSYIKIILGGKVGSYGYC